MWNCVRDTVHEMDMIKTLHMNGGIGDASYASNSTLQRIAITMTKEIIEQAISDLMCCNTKFPETLAVADLGCSSGPNALLVASTIINAVGSISLLMERKSPEIQVHLNDLPTNDFNTLFSLLHEFQKNLTANRNANSKAPSVTYYFTGVPGTFYGRLFLANSLHFVHSSYALHWLSRILEAGKINKGSIHLSSSTPESVKVAYYDQFEKDFMTFLRSRSEEVVAGGRMVLTLLGRRKEDACCDEVYYFWKVLAMAFEDMVLEGLVDEEKLDSFNIPIYTPSPTEIKNLVEKEGSFAINQLQVSNKSWSDWNRNISDTNASELEEMEGHDSVHAMAMGVRAGLESFVENHFGKEIVNDVFMRYEKILINRKPITEKEITTSLTISLTRKL